MFDGLDAVTTDGITVWIADRGNHVLRAMDALPPYGVRTVAGMGVAVHVDGVGADAGFDDLRGVTHYGGYVWLLDGAAATVRRFDPFTGEVLTVAGTPYVTGCPGAVDGYGGAARLCSPRSMASDNSGNLFIADANGNMIRSFSMATSYVGSYAGTGACGYIDGVGLTAAIHRPRGMTSDGTSIYWPEFSAHTVRQGIIAGGNVSTLAGTPPACTLTCSCGEPPAGGWADGVGAAALFNDPFSVVFHQATNSLFVFDDGNSVIRRIR